MYAHFASGLADRGDHVRGDVISHLRNKLKRRSDSILPLQLEDSVAEVLAGTRFHVVGHDGTSIKAFWPIPDEGELNLARRLQRHRPQLPDEILDRRIDRPGRERYLGPVLQGDALQDPANCRRKQRPEGIVDTSRDRVAADDVRARAVNRRNILLETQIVDDFSWVEGQDDRAAPDRNADIDTGKMARAPWGHRTRTDAAVQSKAGPREEALCSRPRRASKSIDVGRRALCMGKELSHQCFSAPEA